MPFSVISDHLWIAKWFKHIWITTVLVLANIYFLMLIEYMVVKYQNITNSWKNASQEKVFNFRANKLQKVRTETASHCSLVLKSTGLTYKIFLTSDCVPRRVFVLVINILLSKLIIFLTLVSVLHMGCLTFVMFCNACHYCYICLVCGIFHVWDVC